MMAYKTKPITAWLIRWEWGGDHAKKENPYVDIVSSRKSIEYMTDYVQRLHNLLCLSLGERVETEQYNNPSEQRYAAQVHRTLKGESHIHCGGNPFLTASLVRDLMIEVSDAGEMISITWEPYKE